MTKLQKKLFALLFAAVLLGVAIAPVNRRTAIQVWHQLNPSSAPRGGLFISGGIQRQIPYEYGDTWISRYHRICAWINPPPADQVLMKVQPRVIVAEDE